LTAERLKIRTAAYESQIPQEEIAGVRVEYDDSLARERGAGGVLIAGGLPLILGGITTTAYALANEPSSGAGVGLIFAGLSISGFGLMMLLPGITLVKSKAKEPEPAIGLWPGGARFSLMF